MLSCRLELVLTQSSLGTGQVIIGQADITCGGAIKLMVSKILFKNGFPTLSELSQLGIVFHLAKGIAVIGIDIGNNRGNGTNL